jgi:hypothetical protein
LYLIDLYRGGVDCLEAVYELRLICLGSLSTGAPPTFDSRSYFFWIGRSLLIRDRALVSPGISMGRICVFFDGLEAVECFSVNEIRSRPLLVGVCFGISFGFHLYTTHLFCSSFFTSLYYSETRLLIIIYLPLTTISIKVIYIETFTF